MRTEAQGWKIVHQRRRPWPGQGIYDGVFLGERDGRWNAGCMFRGNSMDDGFKNDQYLRGNIPEWDFQHEAYRARCALNDYIQWAKEAADCWDRLFEQEASRAVDRHWAERVPLDGVADMSVTWGRSSLNGDVRTETFMMPAVQAKYELLRCMRRSYTVNKAFCQPQQHKVGSELGLAYTTAITAAGPVAVAVGSDRFTLSYDGRNTDLS
ncbi:hypothetical protein [Streptomyces noursei]|uniref:Uncharacterized protein n=1 Tax=Streptomyces noursei TaxID=1971 RepID=A0A2N8PQS0_STRNR|nr:hypothetical protein [Streptomyces noursei]PNE43376.1 hypothetical protein AOB60_00050 [Streptomyces noursei]